MVYVYFDERVINMRKSNPLSTCLVMLGALLGVLICAPILSRAHAPSTSVTIVNNSSREIRHVYLSAPEQNNWGSDQLGSSVIAAGGGSLTLSDVACSGSGVKVITEDHEGCFLSRIVACSEATTWTITDDATPDCGS